MKTKLAKAVALAMALMALPVANAKEPGDNASTEQTRQSYPFDTAWLKYEKIHYYRKATIGTEKVYLVLVSNSHEAADRIHHVYVIKEGEHQQYHVQFHQEYPYITELRYHDLGKGKDFLGVVILKSVYNKNTHQYAGRVIYERRIDDEAGQFLLDFQAGATKWKMAKYMQGLKFTETKSPDMYPVRTK